MTQSIAASRSVRLLASAVLAIAFAAALTGIWLLGNWRSRSAAGAHVEIAVSAPASASALGVSQATAAPAAAEATAAPSEPSTSAQAFLPVTSAKLPDESNSQRSLFLNGAGAHVEVADAPRLRLTKQFTLEAWIRPSAVTGHRHIVGKNYYELSVDPHPAGWVASLEVRSGGTWSSVSSGPLVLGRWYQVAGTYDGSELRVYVDGILSARARATGAVDTSDRPLRIGSADGADDFFHGTIDEVRVADTVRYTDSFAPPAGPFVSDAATVGLWHLDEGSGDRTADASPGAYEGRLVNGAQWTTDGPWEAGPLQPATATPMPAAPQPTSLPATATSVPPTATAAAEPPSRGVGDMTLLSTGSLGYSDVGAHQVVRTSGDRVYLFAPEIYKGYVRALRAGSSGTPSGFAEADQARRPQADTAIWAVDAAIDSRNVVHLLYIAEGGEVVYTTFDTATDRWGAPAVIANSTWPNRNNDLRQGSAGVAIALDAAGVAHVVYGKTEGATRRMYYNNSAGGTWKNEQRVDEWPGNDNSHATLAFAPDGTLYVAWLSAPDGNRGALVARALRNGAWEAPTVVDDSVFANQGYSIDQGPSLVVGPDGTVHAVYIGPYEPVASQPSRYDYGRVQHRQSTDGGRTWSVDDPLPRYTHNPSLWIDPQGNLVLFGHREYWLGERCASMLVTVRPAGGSWTPWRVFADGCFDASMSTRWAQFHRAAPDVLDAVFWTEKGPNGESDMNQLYYAEVRGVDALLELPQAPER